LSEYLQTVFDKFELRVRKGYYYTEDGVWASVEGTKVRIGVTDYAQKTGGDVAFVDLVREGTAVERQAEIGTLETAKTTISLHSPISGTVEQTNATLVGKPELVNSDPYGDGWLAILVPSNLEDDLKALMSAEEYFQLMLEKLETEHEKLESR
jgi:glycine cleavage system H protein